MHAHTQFSRFTFLLLVLSPFCLLAEGTVVLTSESAVRRALEHNLDLAAARTLIAQASGRRLQSGRLQNPDVIVEYASDGPFNAEGQFAYSVGFLQRFPITNRLRLLKDIAQAEIELAEAEVRNQARLLVREVEMRLLDLAETEQQIALRKEMLQLNRKLAGFVEKRIELAEASAVDANQAKIAAFELEHELLLLENRRVEAAAELGAMLALSPGSKVRAEPRPHHPAAVELRPLDGAALAQHPEVVMKRLLEKIATQRTALSRAERWSDIAVKFFYERDRGVDQPVGLTNDRFFGLGVSIPLPLHDRNEGRIAEHEALREQFALEREALSAGIAAKAEALRLKVRQIHLQVSVHDERVTPLVDENLRELEAAYAAGRVDLASVFRSQEQRLRIESEHLELIRLYEEALSEWRATAGVNLPSKQLSTSHAK